MPSSLIGFNRPTISELYDRITSDINNSLPEQDALLANSPLNILATTVTGAFTELYAYMDWMSNQTNILYANGENLELYGQIWGIPRLAASAATGTALFSGVDGYAIPKDTLFQTSTGVQYVATEETIILAFNAHVPIAAVSTGKAGNLAAGSTLTLVNPLSGINPTLTVDSLSGGADVESDEAYRARILNRIKTPPFGGTSDDYYTWMMSQPGVTRCWVKPLANGPGTVKVIVCMDNNYTNGIPDPAAIADLQAYIDTVKPITATVEVAAPVEQLLEFNLADIYPDTATIRENIVNEFKALFLRSGPGSIIYASDLWQAVSLATGIKHHNISTISDIIIGQGSIPILGTITWGGIIV